MVYGASYPMQHGLELIDDGPALLLLRKETWSPSGNAGGTFARMGLTREELSDLTALWARLNPGLLETLSRSM